MKLNWEEIKTEYITGKDSYNKLAEKYGISKRAIAVKGKEGEWAKSRAAHRKQIAEKAIQKVTDEKVNAASELFAAARCLISCVYNHLKESDGKDIPIYSDFRQLSMILRDCKEILDIKTEEEAEEQRLRLMKLRKDIDIGEGPSKIELWVNGHSPEEISKWGD